MLLDSEKRLKGFDFYTNPARWRACTFPFFEAVPATLRFEAGFDENGVGESMDAPVVFHDPGRRMLYLSWGEASRWHAIAPTLALGVADDDTLAQIRLGGVCVQTAPNRP